MRISTIIPAYNRADLIGETLRSVLSQTRAPAEVIVVDDGSTDGTPDVVAGFGKDVTLIRQVNAGAGPARNAGFARSTGEIIHFQDSDDVSSLNSYEVQAAAIETGADMTYGPWLKTRFQGRCLQPERLVLQNGPVPDVGRIALDTLLLSWVTVLQPCLLRRSLVESVGPYRADLKPSEDTEMLYRITAAARNMVHTPASILLYRVHPENQVSQQNLAKRMIDQANLWMLLQRHAEARQDFDWRTRTLFRLKKLHVARQVRPYEPALAELLERDTNFLHRLGCPLRQLLERVRGKLRVMRTGNPYLGIFRAAPLTAGQRDQIKLLGYELPDADSPA